MRTTTVIKKKCLSSQFTPLLESFCYKCRSFTHISQVFADGVHGDCSKTFLVGNVDEPGRKLVEVTKECLDKAIVICGPGVPLKEIGNVIENHANDNGFRIVPDFIGHGIGTFFHGPPQICHYSMLCAFNYFTIMFIPDFDNKLECCLL